MATMKKLMRTTISAICYQRDIFPEDCFEDEAIDSMKLKMLPKLKSKSKTKDKRSCRTRGLSQQQQGASDDDRNNCRLFQEWIEDGVMEALEKRYLRTLVFAVFDGSDGTDAATAKLHECYVYKVKYTDDGDAEGHFSKIGDAQGQTSVLLSSASEIADQCRQIIRNVVSLCNTLKALPQERCLTMKLFYDNDITPPTFQPRFFTDASSDGSAPDALPLLFKDKPLKMKVGNIATPHHAMSMLLQIVDDEGDVSMTSQASSAKGDETRHEAAVSATKHKMIASKKGLAGKGAAAGSSILPLIPEDKEASADGIANLCLQDDAESDNGETECPEYDTAKYVRELIYAPPRSTK